MTIENLKKQLKKFEEINFKLRNRNQIKFIEKAKKIIGKVGVK